MMRESRPTCIAAVTFAIVVPTLVTWVYFDLLAGYPARIQQAAYSIGKLFQFAFPICWIGFWLRHKSWDAGPLSAFAAEVQMKRGKSIAFGVLFGVLVVAAMFAIFKFVFHPDMIQALGSEAGERVQGFSVNNRWKFAVMGLFYAFVHSFLEEYYFRWFIFGQLRRLISFTPALLVSGLAFMSHHVIILGHYFNGLSRETVVLSLAIAIGGVVWAWQYERSKSLLGSWISHLVVDAGIFLIGYDIVKDSL